MDIRSKISLKGEESLVDGGAQSGESVTVLSQFLLLACSCQQFVDSLLGLGRQTRLQSLVVEVILFSSLVCLA